MAFPSVPRKCSFNIIYGKPQNALDHLKRFAFFESTHSASSMMMLTRQVILFHTMGLLSPIARGRNINKLP
jgi:hypothetical protein